MLDKFISVMHCLQSVYNTPIVMVQGKPPIPPFMLDMFTYSPRDGTGGYPPPPLIFDKFTFSPCDGTVGIPAHPPSHVR